MEIELNYDKTKIKKMQMELDSDSQDDEDEGKMEEVIILKFSNFVLLWLKNSKEFYKEIVNVDFEFYDASPN